MIWYLIKYDIVNYFNPENRGNSLLYFIFVLIPCIYGAISLAVYLGESGNKLDLMANFFFLASTSSVLGMLVSNKRKGYSIKKILLFPISKNQISIYLVYSMLINLINKVLFIFIVVYGLFDNLIQSLILACCLIVLNGCLTTYFQILLMKYKLSIILILSLPVFFYFLIVYGYYFNSLYFVLGISLILIFLVFARIKRNIDINII